MRDHYQVDWAFAIKNSFDNVVQENFPQDIHRWPVLKAFDFDSYLLNEFFAASANIPPLIPKRLELLVLIYLSAICLYAS